MRFLSILFFMISPPKTDPNVLGFASLLTFILVCIPSCVCSAYICVHNFAFSLLFVCCMIFMFNLSCLWLPNDFCAWVCIFVNVYFLAALRTQRPRKPLQLTRAGTWQPFGTECWPSRLNPHSRRDPLRPGALSLLLLSSFDSLAKGF